MGWNYLSRVKLQPLTYGNGKVNSFYILLNTDYSSMPGLKLTHWGRVTHICVGDLTIIGSDNGLSPERHQAVIWTNAGILLIGPLGTNFSELLIEIQTFSLKKIRLKMSSAKCCSFRLGLNELKQVSKRGNGRVYGCLCFLWYMIVSVLTK